MTELRLKTTLTLALLAVDAIWIAAKGLSFDPTSLAECFAITAAMAAIGFVYTRVRPDEKLAALGTETAFLVVFSAAACVFSYLVTRIDRPLIDKLLARSDKMMGFDWHAYIAFANAHPLVGDLSSLVYQSTLMQIAFAVIVLATLGRVERTRELTLLVMVSSILCVAVSGIFPSEGALAYYHPSAAFYMQNRPVVDLAYKQQFFDIRNGLMTHLSLKDLHGLVAFPSYHAALSVILMFAFRGTRLFWPVVALNMLVILSTPIDGGHHLTDAMGGAALALLSAALVVALRKRLAAAPAARTQEAGAPMAEDLIAT